MHETIPAGGAGGLLSLERPAAPIAASLWRIRAVIPCFNRATDLKKLLQDLAAQDVGESGRVDLSILVVDNASEVPLEQEVAAPPELHLQFLRLESNLGGSGGFNAGLGHWLQRGIPGDACELLWLIDSDARLRPAALRELVRAMEDRPDLAMAGSALEDPESGQLFEVGGRVDFRTGEYIQEVPPDLPEMLEVQYAAACSLLVRRWAAERSGLMPDVFLNGDDVEWCYRVSRLTGHGVGIATRSRAVHPRPDRMRTGARYYAARNALRAISEAGRPRPGRVVEGRVVRKAQHRRALRELARGLSQALVGRADLGWLHIRGLEDAAAGLEGAAAEGTIAFEPFRLLGELPAAIKAALGSGVRGRVLVRPGVLDDPGPVLKAVNALCFEPVVRDEPHRGGVQTALRVARRLVLGPEFGLAMVSARGRLADLALARVMVTVAEGGFAVRELRRRELLRDLASMSVRGLRAARRLREGVAGGVPEAVRTGPRPTLSVVILSYNRWEKLRATLVRLGQDSAVGGAEVIVADNGSTDGTLEGLAAEFPRVRVLAVGENIGVAAFNRGVRESAGEAVLILDDDAWPEEGALEGALRVLGNRADIGAVTLHPRHPETRTSEWRFAEGLDGPREDWPVMGCANLVRRTAWDVVGGYEEAFFLYRNDTDLALKLLGAGYGVYFDPGWVVWHDSPAAAQKSLRWFELAVRNWVWVCRRHGRGLAVPAGVAMGWLWAHRLAGWSPARHWRALRGLAKGVVGRAPAVPATSRAGRIHELLGLRLGRAERGGQPRNSSSMPRHSP